ncbi:MAG TPA: cation transporter [Promineifilum sp.]|nr:cation transporter [Promineifilum sp.]
MDEQRFQIAGMDCADCARSIEKGVARLDEVDSAELNFTTGTLCVRGSAPAERVVARVRELGYDVEDGRGAGAGAQGSTASLELSPAPRPPRSPAPLLAYFWGRGDTRAALIAALLVLPGLVFDELLPGLGVASPVFAGMAVLAMIIAGWPIARSAVRACASTARSPSTCS